MLDFDIIDEYKGIGVSRGLDRGLVALRDGKIIVEEGMGIGAVAVQADGYTYFSSVRSVQKENGRILVISDVDKRLEWKALGLRLRPLTRALEYICTNVYMKNEKKQGMLLRLGGMLRKIFNVEACFVEVPSKGEVRTLYSVNGNEVSVDLSCDIKKKACRIFVMNEMGAGIFDKGVINGNMSEPPSGWQKIEKECELLSSTHSLKFAILESRIPDGVASQLYWGREMAEGYCWAGFESEIFCDSGRFENYQYSIIFKEVTI